MDLIQLENILRIVVQALTWEVRIPGCTLCILIYLMKLSFTVVIKKTHKYTEALNNYFTEDIQMGPIFEVLTTNNKLLSELRALLNQ